jgi:hypothetical protein
MGIDMNKSLADPAARYTRTNVSRSCGIAYRMPHIRLPLHFFRRLTP